MAGNYKELAIFGLLLRLVTMALLLVSAYLIVTDSVSYSFDPSFKTRFQNLIGYRYVLATSCIGLLYSLLLIPVTIFVILTQAKEESIKHTVEICMIGDKVISFLLATGVGAGLLVSIDVRRVVHGVVTDGLEGPEVRTKLDEYLKRGLIATLFLLIGSLCMVVNSIITCVIRTRIKTTGFFR